MKKRIFIGLLSVVMVMASAGCSKTGKIDDSDYLRMIESANTYDALTAANGTFRSVSFYHYGDGTTEDVIYYGDKDTVLFNDATGSVVISNGEAYGYDVDDGYYKWLFPGNYFDYHRSVNWLWKLTSEKIISKKEKNGLIYLETYSDEADNIEYFADIYKYGKEEIEKLILSYVIDAKDNEILENTEYVVIKGEKILCATTRLERGVEKQYPDQKIIDALSRTDTRTLTVITDGGTAQEKAYSRTVPKGCGIYVFFGNDFEPVRYSDKECTVEVPEADYYTDATYYLKRITE